MYPIYYPVEGDTLPILFSTYAAATGASITMTGLAVTDIEIYKDGDVVQRASDAGYTLLDTDGIDIDGITGIHGFSINLADNTDAGFFTVGPWYHVVVSAITVDSQTVNFIAAAFRILAATRGMAGTALPDAAANAAGGLPISTAGGLNLDAQIGADIDAILVDTAEIGVAGAGLTNINLPDQTMNITGNIIGSVSKVLSQYILETTVVTRTTNAIFTIADGMLIDNIYTDCVIAIQDVTDSHWEMKRINSYVGATRTIYLQFSVGFTIATGDVVRILQTSYNRVMVTTLRADVITAAAFDESTAFPLKSADTGATQIARVGADADTLKTLSDQLDTVKTDTAAVLVDTAELQTDLTDGGRLDLLIDAIKVITDALGATAAARLALSAGTMVPGTNDNTAFTATPTAFEADDITEATPNHFLGRTVIWTSGALKDQKAEITAYSKVGANGHFVVESMTESPADNDTFIIV